MRRVINFPNVREVPLVRKRLPSFDVPVGYRMHRLCCWLNSLYFFTFVFTALFLKPQERSS